MKKTVSLNSEFAYSFELITFQAFTLLLEKYKYKVRIDYNSLYEECYFGFD